MRNVEAKFRLDEPETQHGDPLAAVRARALSLGARVQGRLEQVDTYFFAPNGRLKLREITRDGQAPEAWLIGYQRADAQGARLSAYEMAPVTDPAALLAVLRPAMGVRARVVKSRDLLLLRHTRIHLDTVRGLGSFVELETLVGAVDSRRGAEAQGVASEAEGARELAEIAVGLGLSVEDGLAGSYADLLEGARGLGEADEMEASE